LEDYKDLISTLATVATICQFLTGSKICRDFMRKGSTGDVSGVPLVVGALNSCCWFRYSLLIDDAALIVVNGTGACLNTIWTAAYYAYTQRKLLIQVQIVGAVSFFLTLMTYVSYASHESAVSANGTVAAGIAVVLMASPLANLNNVLRTQSTESLPFPMIVANFVLTGLWTLYGDIIEDSFVKVPNGLGWILSVLQLLLFCIFPSGRGPTTVQLGRKLSSSSKESLIA